MFICLFVGFMSRTRNTACLEAIALLANVAKGANLG